MRRVILTLAVATLVFGALATEAQVRKYVRYEVGGEVSYGLLEGDSIQPLSGGLFDSPQPRGEAIALADVRLLAPVEPPMVLAVGLNYQSHLGDRDPAAEPGIFLKTPRSIIGPGEAIVIPRGRRTCTTKPSW